MEELFNQIKLEIYERCENGLISEEEKDILLEAAEERYFYESNKDYKEKMKELKNRYKSTLKNIRNYKKNGNNDAASREIDDAISILKSTKKEISEMDDTTGMNVISIVIELLKNYLTTCSVAILIAASDQKTDPKIYGFEALLARSIMNISTAVKMKKQKTWNVYKAQLNTIIDYQIKALTALKK